MGSETPPKIGCAMSKLSFAVPIPLERMEAVVHMVNETYPTSMTGSNDLQIDIECSRTD
jgi:hypothetical protein